MIKREFYIAFSKNIDLHCLCWLPEGEPSAVLQIVHGMIDYADRYDNVARHLACRGIAVVAHDQVGHGLTAKSEADLGYIPWKGGAKLLCDCTLAVTEWIKKNFESIPNFIMGHSMGSFVTRRFLTLHGDRVCGAVIMGTGNQSLAVVSLGKLLAGAIGKIFGVRHRSKFLNNLVFAPYSKRCEKWESKNAWISSVPEFMEAHDKDPLATFGFTASGFYVLFDLLAYLAKGVGFDNIPKTLPILILSGMEDPVGSYGRDPEVFAKKCRSAGIRDVDLRLYENDRHEVLNEADGERVMEDLFVWLKAHIC